MWLYRAVKLNNLLKEENTKNKEFQFNTNKILYESEKINYKIKDWNNHLKTKNKIDEIFLQTEN